MPWIAQSDLLHQTSSTFTADHFMGDLITQASPTGSLLNDVAAHAL
ncbi:MAG: hypothetical protein R3C17_09485 [Planctomycetaceae bacterium]